MPYFREAFEDDITPLDPVERLETARWLHWAGWDADAHSLLRSICLGILDRTPTEEEVKEFGKED